MNEKILRDGKAGNIFLQSLSTSEGRALIALFLVFLLGLIFNADGAFFKLGTHRDMLRQESTYGILACGMTLVIITGGIDLSVGSVLGLSAVCFSLMSIHWGLSPFISVPVCLIVGALSGFVTGACVSWLKIQAFIASLAMYSLARGVAKWISGGKKVSGAILNSDGSYRYVDVPGIFRAIDSRIFDGNLTMVTVIFLVCLIIAYLFLSRHNWGRQVYAVGGNEEAARLSGVNVNFTKLMAYIAAGTLSSIAGLCQAAQEQQGDPEAGVGYELTAIAMVVIGGTSLMGGRGGLGLTLLGFLTIGYMDKILSINAVPEAGRLVFKGVIIILAVLIQGRKK